MNYVLIIILFILCLYDYLKYKQILSPTLIFNTIWFITLLLYEFKLSYLQQDLSNRTILIFYICVFSYNIVIFLLKKINYKPSNILFVKSKISFCLKNKLKLAKLIAIIIFLIEVVYSGGVPLIWKLLGINRTYFDFGIPSLNGAFYGLIILLGAYSLSQKSWDKYLYLSMGLLMLSRQVIISIILEGLLFGFITKKVKISVQKVVLILTCLFLAFTVLGNLRSGSNEMNKVFKAKEEYTNIPTSIKWAYSYMTFSVSNFNNLVSMTGGNVNHGVTIIEDLLPNIILKKIEIKKNFSSNYLVSLNYTVSTYLPSLYLDFGIIGIVIFNVLIAFFGYRLYFKIKKNDSVSNNDAMCYSIYVHNIVFLFFNNMFLYLPIIVQFFYSLIIFGKNNEKSISG